MKKTEQIYSGSPMAELTSDDGSQRLRIYTYGYQFPDARNVFDADWQMNHISLFFKGVKVETNGPFLESSELKTFKEELVAFNLNIGDALEFISTDQQLIIFLTRQDDKICVSGEIYNQRPENGDYVTEFNFKSNSDLMEKFISGIEKILVEYPSRPWVGDWR